MCLCLCLYINDDAVYVSFISWSVDCVCMCRDVEILSQLPDILTYMYMYMYFYYCTAPIYIFTCTVHVHVYSSVSIFRTFTEYIGQCAA